ncbi:MAG: DUF29 domain-containing protein [Geminicoccaceae bacterium]|nr:DUF29 domain-containing protein [Geminicoccaceae bacterium]MCX8100085.1 DUF29 domain-containing protein [Geminicoccaceae bacterium]MDW8371371.1 DUF29 domain-containing protein [Geminicoccaceae bacterium]
MSTASLYEEDFYRWSQEQALALRKLAAMRANLAVPLDLEHLAEEIESVGISQLHALRARLRQLLAHLLKWRFQPERRTRSWRSTIRVQRDAIADLLESSPSLRRRLGEELAKAYEKARRQAADETGLPLAAFPEACPFTVEEVEDPEFLP